MNKTHTMAATFVAIFGSVVAAYTPKIQAAALAYAAAHPTLTFIAVGMATAIAGALPSSIGAHPDGPSGPSGPNPDGVR